MLSQAKAWHPATATPSPQPLSREGRGGLLGEKDSRCLFPKGPEGCSAEKTPGVFFAPGFLADGRADGEAGLEQTFEVRKVQAIGPVGLRLVRVGVDFQE